MPTAVWGVRDWVLCGFSFFALRFSTSFSLFSSPAASFWSNTSCLLEIRFMREVIFLVLSSSRAFAASSSLATLSAIESGFSALSAMEPGFE